jgi:hypothetical protein
MQHEIPNDVNGDVLRRLLASGDNLSIARNIDFEIIFPDERSGMQFIDDIEEKFDEVRIRLRDEEFRTRGLDWNVTACVVMVPNHKDISELEDFLETAASPYGGEIDGWGCFTVES